MEGYLFKRSEHLKRWNKRYFRLEGSVLQYFQDQNAKTERGSWRIDPTSSIAKYTERVNAFTILVGGKPIILAADDEMALEKWENALAVPMGKVRRFLSRTSLEKSRIETAFSRTGVQRIGREQVQSAREET